MTDSPPGARLLPGSADGGVDVADCDCVGACGRARPHCWSAASAATVGSVALRGLRGPGR